MNKVLHFDEGFSLKEILKYISNNKNILYYTRIVNGEFHIIKHNNDSFFNIDIMCSELLKFYENTELKPLLGNVKIKGNNNFAIINCNTKLTERLKIDLNRLLNK